MLMMERGRYRKKGKIKFMIKKKMKENYGI